MIAPVATRQMKRPQDCRWSTIRLHIKERPNRCAVRIRIYCSLVLGESAGRGAENDHDGLPAKRPPVVETDQSRSTWRTLVS
jgi:hypothetical protein